MKSIKEKCPVLKLIDNCYDAHSGQQYCRIVAYNKKTNDYLGRIDYSIFEDEIYVDMIEVEREYRRLGIATKMLKKLEQIYHDMPFHYGYITQEGNLLLRKLNMI